MRLGYIGPSGGFSIFTELAYTCQDVQLENKGNSRKDEKKIVKLNNFLWESLRKDYIRLRVSLDVMKRYEVKGACKKGRANVTRETPDWRICTLCI